MPDDRSDTRTDEALDTDWSQALAETLKAGDAESGDTDEKSSTAGTGEASPEESKDSKPEAKTVAESKDALQPLETWSDEIKTHFATLDEKSRQFLLDRHKEFEGDYTRKTQDVADTRKRYERLDEVLKPYDEVARRSGVDMAPIVASSIQLYLAAQRDPLSLVRNYIAANQLTAEQLGFGAKDEEIDPNTRALQAQLVNTQRAVANLQQGNVQATQNALLSQINAFKDAKDESGAPKHPYFDRVRSLMAPLVDSGKTMDEAYAETVWSVPEYRASRETTDRTKSEKETKEKAERERQQKLKVAKRAETLPSSDAEKGKPKSEFKGWDKALMEELSQMQ